MRTDGSGGGGGQPVHDVLAGLALIDEGIALASAAGSGLSLGATELAAIVARMARQAARFEAVRLRQIAALDAAVQTESGDLTSYAAVDALLGANVGHQQASAAVRAARELDPDTGMLPLLGQALAAGEISAQHVDVAVRAVRQIPRRLLTQVDASGRTGAQAVDAFLAEQARSMPPRALGRVVEALLDVLDPDRTGRFDPDGHTRRRLDLAEDATGMTVGRLLLDGAGGALLRAAVDLLARPRPAGPAEDADGGQTRVRDARSPGERRADALVDMARAVLAGRRAPAENGSAGNGSAAEGGTAAPVATVLIVATPEQLAAARAALPSDGAPVDAAAIARGSGRACTEHPGPGLTAGALGLLGCDAIVQLVVRDPNGQILSLGRSTRLASRAQRRALIARDRGCAFPGCDAPPSVTEAHHVVWWRHGGRTDIDNMALLCPHHHAVIHSGRWVLTMRDGVPWAIPPATRDPDQTPLRNTTHTATRDATDLGRQLMLGLDPQVDPPDPDPQADG